MNKILLTLMAIIAISGCKTNKSQAESSQADAAAAEQITSIAPQQMVGGATKALPKAVVYKTTKDYFYNVPVSLNDNGTGFNYYPDPSDITESQLPVRLVDGYLLDRRGLGKNPAFTSYTYEEYSALSRVPSKEQLLKSIINKSPILEMYRLPMTANEAAADTAKVNAIIRGGFKDCTVLYSAPTISISE